MAFGHPSAVIIKSYPELEPYLYSFILHTSLRLDRIKNLLEKLGNPQNKFPSIVVAGTAGKGSTSTMLASIFAENGLKVGLYTSPHLVKLNERFKINNKDISDKELMELVNQISVVIPTNPVKPKDPSTPLGMTKSIPSYFEILTTIAFLWFAKHKIDVAVLEVGMGGQYDATNIVDNKISILTNVGLDHTEFLGKTIEKIAQEKVAILKKNGILITGVTQPSVKKIIKNYAKKQKARVIFAKKINFKTKMLGDFQAKNASLSVAAARQFKSNIRIKKGLQKAYIPGRLEIISEVSWVTHSRSGYYVILDGAHNVMKMQALVNSLQKIYPGKKFVTIFAAKKDKDIKIMIKLLSPIVSKFIITRFTLHTDFGPHQAAKPKDIAKYIKKNYQVIEDPKLALKTALDGKDFPVLITGSLYLVGEIKQLILP